MGEVEHEQAQNDLEVEITHIDVPGDGASSDGNIEPAHSSKSPRSSLQLRFLPRQRKTQLAITMSIVVLALLIILGSSASVRELTVSVFTHSITPTATLAPGANLFYVRGNPPWGHLSLDGQSITRLPAMGRDQPFRLSRGQHRFVWKADPFPSQSCIVSVPFSDSDTCVHREVAAFDAQHFAWVINFTPSLTMLPDDQRASLIQAAQSALDIVQSTDTVQPGETYYGDTYPCGPSQPAMLCYGPATDTHPLLATLHFQLATEAANGSCVGLQGHCSTSEEDCHSFCTGSTIQAASASQEWDVFAVVRPLWEYATLEGKVIAHDVPDNAYFGSITGDIRDDYLAHLHITWDGQRWRATALLTNAGPTIDPTCGPALDLTTLGGFLNLATINDMPIQWLYATDSNQAAGCLAKAIPRQNPLATTTPSSSPLPAAYCLYRFGVLLAANDLAHHLWPDLPVANAYERSLAQQLATLVQLPSA